MVSRRAGRPYDPKRARIALIALSVAFVGAVAIFAGIYARETPEANAYARAAVCPAGRAATDPAADCRQQARATVARLYTAGSGRTQRLLIQVRFADGARAEAQLPYERLWQALDGGDMVTVEMWRGRIMRVQALIYDDPTSGNPVWRRRNTAAGGTAIAAILGAVLLFGWTLLLVRTRRARAGGGSVGMPGQAA